MSQKENKKGFFIFAIGSGLMGCLAVLLASALTGNVSLSIASAVTVVMFATGIYFLPKKAFR